MTAADETPDIMENNGRCQKKTKQNKKQNKKTKEGKKEKLKVEF